MDKNTAVYSCAELWLNLCWRYVNIDYVMFYAFQKHSCQGNNKDHALNFTVFVIWACATWGHNNVKLVNSYTSETLNNYSNIEIGYCQISERCEVMNFHRKTGSTQCWCCFCCLKIVLCMSLACKNSIKYK